MTRSIADSLETITTRHQCIGPLKWEDGLITKVEAHSTIVIVEDDLSRINTIRNLFELVEIYAQQKAADTLYEPLSAKHFAQEASFALVLRRRHPSNNARIVGLMLAKDEADIISDVLECLTKNLDALYYYCSDDQITAKAISQHSPPGWARAIPRNELICTDGMRQILLEQARRDAKTDADPRPMWVVSAQGDEIYHDDLRQHICLAQAERATLLTCQVATFLLHESQQEEWDWTQPLEQRLTHYIWDFGEHVAHLDFPWVYYDVREHMRAHPHGTWPSKWAKARPVRKHYPFRSPEQARKRIEDRLKSGWQPHYENYRAIFMGKEAAGREIKRYYGWFPEAERIEGIW